MWKYKSQDIEHISLHDCSFGEILVEDNDVLLIFNEGFDIVKTHPLNDTGNSKNTTKSQIVLKNAKFIYGKSDYWNKEMCDFAEFINYFSSFEILEFRIDNGEIVFNGYFSPKNRKNSSNQHFMSLSFLCADVIFCWNDYSADAWFAE